MSSRGWESVTMADVTRRELEQGQKAAHVPATARSKYHAVRTTVGDRTFASRKEARRYQELLLLQQAGAITQLILQPRYGIYVRPFAQLGVDSTELIKCGDYVGDFQYWQDGVKVLEDTKGWRTPVYRLKKRLVEALYGIRIHEV